MMMTRQRATMLFSDGAGEFSFDIAKRFFSDDFDKVMQALHIFYGTAEDEEIEIKTNFFDSHVFDHHEQEMDEIYGTPGGQYDRDTRCFCIPRRN